MATVHGSARSSMRNGLRDQLNLFYDMVMDQALIFALLWDADIEGIGTVNKGFFAPLADNFINDGDFGIQYDMSGLGYIELTPSTAHTGVTLEPTLPNGLLFLDNSSALPASGDPQNLRVIAGSVGTSGTDIIVPTLTIADGVDIRLKTLKIIIPQGSLL